MSHPAAGAPHQAGDGAHVEHVHPGPLVYVKIAVVLTILTAAEVGVWYTPIGALALTLILIVLSISKFVLVVAFYMHLKYDSRLFTAMFAWGILLSLSIICALIAMYHNFYIGV